MMHAYFIGGPLDLTKKVISYPPPRTMPFYQPQPMRADYDDNGVTTTPCDRLIYIAGPVASVEGFSEKVICYLYFGKEPR